MSTGREQSEKRVTVLIGDSADHEGQDVAVTVRNARALSAADRRGWQQEIVAALVWAERHGAGDPFLEHDLRALRHIVPVGVCLVCDGPCPADGRHWCSDCSAKDPKGEEMRS